MTIIISEVGITLNLPSYIKYRIITDVNMAQSAISLCKSPLIYVSELLKAKVPADLSDKIIDYFISVDDLESKILGKPAVTLTPEPKLKSSSPLKPLKKAPDFSMPTISLNDNMSDSKIQDLESQIADKDKILNEIQLKYQSLEQNNVDLKKLSAKKEALLQEAQAKLSDYEVELSLQKNQSIPACNVLQTPEYVELQQSHTKLEARFDFVLKEMELQAQKYAAKIQASENNVVNADQILHYTEQLKHQDEEYAKIKKENESVSDQLKTEKERVQALNADLSAIKVQLSDSAKIQLTEKESLKAEISQLNTTIEHQKSEISDLIAETESKGDTEQLEKEVVLYQEKYKILKEFYETRFKVNALGMHKLHGKLLKNVKILSCNTDKSSEFLRTWLKNTLSHPDKDKNVLLLDLTTSNALSICAGFTEGVPAIQLLYENKDLLKSSMPYKNTKNVRYLPSTTYNGLSMLGLNLENLQKQLESLTDYKVYIFVDTYTNSIVQDFLKAMCDICTIGLFSAYTNILDLTGIYNCTVFMQLQNTQMWLLEVSDNVRNLKLWKTCVDQLKAYYVKNFVMFESKEIEPMIKQSMLKIM